VNLEMEIGVDIKKKDIEKIPIEIDIEITIEITIEILIEIEEKEAIEIILVANLIQGLSLGLYLGLDLGLKVILDRYQDLGLDQNQNPGLFQDQNHIRNLGNPLRIVGLDLTVNKKNKVDQIRQIVIRKEVDRIAKGGVSDMINAIFIILYGFFCSCFFV